MSDIGARIREISARVQAAALAAGRDPDTVTLVAVSKTFPAEAIAEALAAGQRVFGESRAQELRDKATALGAGPVWHFIGNLQQNKVRLVVGRVAMVETVDSLEIAEALDARVRATDGDGGPNPLPVLLQVLLCKGVTRHGAAPADVLALASEVAALPGLSLHGLMTVPPYREDPEEGAADFARLASLAAEGRARGLPLNALSMGMSHDFEVAVRCGATLVRVGTAIFGAR